MADTLAVRKTDSGKQTPARMLSIWNRNFFASLSIARQQKVTPLSLRETLELLKNPQEVARLLRENKDELEAYLQKNPEMHVTRKEFWKIYFSKLHTFWTSTITAYSGQEPLGKMILGSECAMGLQVQYSFPVPKRFRGMKDVLLLVEFPDYGFDKKLNGSGGLDVSVEANPRKVHVIEEFPAWVSSNINVYAPHPVFGIPYGKALCHRWAEQKPEEATGLKRWPTAFVAPATVEFPLGIISVDEPMSRGYHRILISEKNSGDSHS